MGELTRSFDWSESPIGAMDTWPQSLAITLGNVLHSGFPMFLFWGDELTCFYNDAFRPSLGANGKHPALGRKGREVWAEIWNFVGPLIEGVLETGEPVWFENQLIPFYRNGRIEDIYWTFSYSQVLNDEGIPGGVLVTCMETTDTVSKTPLGNQTRVYEVITAATPDLIYVFDLQYRFTYVNKALLDMWGKTWNTAVGKGLRDNGYEEWHAAMHEREIDQIVLTKQPMRGEVSFPHATLGSRVYDYILVPVLNEKGEVESVAGTTRDITELKRAEWKIIESETRFRTMAEGTNVLIAVGDETSNATYFNKAWTDITGRQMDELLKFGWSDLIHPDDKERYINIYLDAFKIKAPFTGEFRVRNQKGEYRWLLAEGVARFDPDKKFLGYISSCIDITERKLNELALVEKEAALQNAIQLARLGTWKLELATKMITLSPRHAEMLGLDELVVPSAQVLAIISETDREHLLALFKKSGHASKDKNYDAEFQIRNVKDGQHLILHALAKASYDSKGNMISVEGTSQDVTGERQLQLALQKEVHFRTQELAATNEELQAANEELSTTNEELSESTEQLIRTNQELGQFAYAASHDLQEPLRKIRTFSDRVLRIDNLPEKGIDWTTKINQSAERMTMLIKSLLEFSHLAKPEEAFELVDLNEITTEIVKDFQHVIEEKNATLQIDELPTVLGSKVQMQQLFGNLLSNALKFAQQGLDPMIAIRSELLAADDTRKYIPNPKASSSYFHISVSDNGIGFESEYAEHIFEIFKRLHTLSEYKGSGIGLALCKRIVINHRGYINAYSAPGKGSTFHIFLPTES